MQPAGEPMNFGMEADVQSADLLDELHAISIPPDVEVRNKKHVFTRTQVNDVDGQILARTPEQCPCSIPKPTMIYNNIGTLHDSPLSLAICPQRSCVAFGCRTGIELHWTDATTGSDMSRWLPTAAPNHHLFFLPQRANIDVTDRLRLVSSAAGPFQQQRSTVCDSSSFRAVGCDHYRAIPLSDGAHMLFTDSLTRSLCLGSEASAGSARKLLRKVYMTPPPSNHSRLMNRVRLYKAAHELRWGVRVVAVYGNGQVVFYNIPSTYFERIRYARSYSEVSVSDDLSSLLSMDDLDSSHFDSRHFKESRRSSMSLDTTLSFPCLRLHGREIYHTDDIINDIHIDCAGGGVKVWLFSRKTVKLDIYAPTDYKIKEMYVDADGFVQVTSHDKETRASDSDEDTPMDCGKRVEFQV